MLEKKYLTLSKILFVEIVPVAFDSLGARSMATFVKTKDVKIMIDPSVALGPRRYGLPPHKIEHERKNYLWKEIKRFVRLSDIVIVSHYHYDHHNPNETEILENKILFVKHPTENINLSQKKRAAYFLQQLKSSQIHFADGSTLEEGNTQIVFSEALPHGTNTRLGFVVMTGIFEKTTFVHTSDVEGVCLDDQLQWLINFDPETAFVDGALTYMLGYRFLSKEFQKSVENLKKLMEKTKVKDIVLDHHLTRDLNWRDRMREVFDFAKEMGVRVMSAAEFIGKREDLLEARRKELYSKYNFV